MTSLHAIVDRHKEPMVKQALISDFHLDSGVETDARILLDEPNWTPYCIDDGNRRVLFVQTTPQADLSTAAFVYIMQFQEAQKAVIISYDDLVKLVGERPMPVVLFIHSTGRCGSTLLNQVLNQLDTVYSLSEPDIYTNLIAPGIDDTRHDELVPVARALTYMLYPNHAETPSKMLGIKFRSMTVKIAQLLAEAVPEARNLFMYRQGNLWAHSFYRLVCKVGFVSLVLPMDDAIGLWKALMEDTDYFLTYIDRESQTVDFGQFAGIFWIYHLDKIHQAFDASIAFMCICYDELINERERILRQLFEYCNLPMDQMEQAVKGFDEDSQAGTDIARDETQQSLPDKQIQAFEATIAKHPRFNTADYVLPVFTRE